MRINSPEMHVKVLEDFFVCQFPNLTTNRKGSVQTSKELQAIVE
jgi:hypothetical protein